MQEGPCSRVRDEGFGAYALLSRHGGVVDRWGDFPWAREMLHQDPKEVHDGGLQNHVYTHDHELEESRCIQGEGFRPHHIQAIDCLSHVFGQHQGRYILCNKHS